MLSWQCCVPCAGVIVVFWNVNVISSQYCAVVWMCALITALCHAVTQCRVPYAAAVPCAVCVVIGVVVVSWSRKMPVSVNGISSSSSKSWRWPHCFYRPCYRQLSHVADCDIACQILRAYLFLLSEDLLFWHISLVTLQFVDNFSSLLYSIYSVSLSVCEQLAGFSLLCEKYTATSL